MRVLLFLTLIVLLFISIQGQSVNERHDTDDHDEIVIPDEHDVQQTTGRTGAGMSTPTTTPTRPTTTTTRSRTGRTRRIPRFPRTIRRGMMFPGMMSRRPRVTDMFRDPTPGTYMTPGMTRLAMMERRMLMNAFRQLLQLRMRAMFGDMPMSRWEKRMIRMMALRDLMMMMNIQSEDANELAAMMEEREIDSEDRERETMDETDTETLNEPEVDETASEHEIEAVPEDEVDVEDPALIEAEFDIQAPYGGYGGYGYGGGYGGFGGKKKGGYGGFGGYGYGGKKGGGFKKVPYKKVPYKKVPFKKGGFGI